MTDRDVRREFTAAVELYMEEARRIFNTDVLPDPAVTFKVRGRTCWGRAYLREWKVDFNILAHSLNPQSIEDTAAHEVAHLVAYRLYGDRGHGYAWKRVMRNLGRAPERCVPNKVVDVPPARKVKTFKYVCKCRSWDLTSIRHNRILKGRTYSCPDCRTKLQRGLTFDGTHGTLLVNGKRVFK